MANSCDLLVNGIAALRQGDKDIECLVAPRCKQIISLLDRYIKEIELFNPAYGLVGAVNTEELIVKHILDSLAPLGIISRLMAECLLAEKTAEQPEAVLKIADAGSGAGLPGIPLAITMPDIHFTLIERMGRRVGFLLNTKAVLSAKDNHGLSNITVEEGDFEQIVNEKTIAGKFSLVTFRAFKPLNPKLLKSLFKACRKGGKIAAYKGKREKIEQEMAPLEKLCGSWEAIPCSVPFLDEERHLLVISPA